MLFLLPGLKVCLVLLGLAALFSLLTLILGADVRLVNERLIFMVDPRRALAFLIAMTEPNLFGCVHTDGLLTILPLRGPAVHLYLRTYFSSPWFVTKSVRLTLLQFHLFS